jgi:hypothetical protein
MAESKAERRAITDREFTEWLARVKSTGVAEHLSGTALLLVYCYLGNDCWRKEHDTLAS